MGRVGRFSLVMACILALLFPSAVSAWEGDCGYEGGISSGAVPGKTTLEYQEVSFIAGTPVVLKGTLTIKKSLKNDSINATYTYYLKNADRSATLTRVLTFTTKLSKKDNGQTVEETSFTKTPSETLKIGDVSYVLESYDYTRTSLVDPRPGISYYAGNTWGRKVYRVGGANGGTVTLEATGSFYGYDEFWGSSEVELFDYVIESEMRNGDTMDRWGGTASVALSSSMTKKLEYFENRPEQISFSGGFVQTQNNSSILEYSSQLPEFDAEGVSTDALMDYTGSFKLESFPVQTRLPVADLRHLKGHWAERDIHALYSLEILKGGEDTFDPEELITRAQFTSIVNGAVKEVPTDPSLASKSSSRASASRKNTKEKIVSPFLDVSVDSFYFASIDTVYKRGLMGGTGEGFFRPGEAITLADALVVFVRALGLESLAPSPTAVTGFMDNDSIPLHARNACYVAERIGLVQADEWGNLNPLEKLTKARTAELVNRFINYMREGIREDYRDRIVNYQ